MWKAGNFLLAGEFLALGLVLDTGGICHDPLAYWALAPQKPERERSRATFREGRLSLIRVFLVVSGLCW